tara:strand:+ start:192 stop:938 length:747 start_codon:yes stop_codon:yes gene_type:complete
MKLLMENWRTYLNEGILDNWRGNNTTKDISGAAADAEEILGRAYNDAVAMANDAMKFSDHGGIKSRSMANLEDFLTAAVVTKKGERGFAIQIGKDQSNSMFGKLSFEYDIAVQPADSEGVVLITPVCWAKLVGNYGQPIADVINQEGLEQMSTAIQASAWRHILNIEGALESKSESGIAVPAENLQRALGEALRPFVYAVDLVYKLQLAALQMSTLQPSRGQESERTFNQQILQTDILPAVKRLKELL